MLANIAYHPYLTRDGGVPTLEPAEVGFSVSQTNLRFYYAEDAALAERVGELLGVTPRDFVGSKNLPPQGQLYLYIQGGASPSAKPAPQRKAAPRVSENQRLQQAIIGKLRAHQFSSD